METNEKIERLLDMTEHPEHYSEEEMQEILADKETREYYDLIIKTDDAYTKSHDVDVDKALQEFETKHSHHFSLSKIAAILIGILLVSGITYAAIVINRSSSNKQSVRKAQIEQVMADKPAKSINAETTDTTTTQKEQLFDNVELQTILDDISSYYKLKVIYHSDKSRHLRLHFYWDKTKDAETIVESLNHFENVNMTLTDSKIDVK
ncbi:FecR domain-containing protein [Prevotella sp.]|uniref:FecR domain-containing protein n=1 Tax=Prevotella sp. TaxID=59823 RepID=UPI003DA431B6